MSKRKDNAIYDYQTGELVCTACGHRQPGPKLPMPVKQFCKEVRGFSDDHARCQPAKDPVPTENP